MNNLKELKGKNGLREFISIEKVFECLTTGKRSRFLLDVLPPVLTLDPNYMGTRGIPFTLFKEIRLVPFKELVTEEMEKLFTTRSGSIKMEKPQFFSRLREKLNDIVVANWKPELNHIMLHSSGIDSRIISWSIRNLFRKNGSDWLGRIVFLCSKNEGSSFKKIMEYEGWKKNQYLVVGEELKDEEVYAQIFADFKNAWRRAGGTFSSVMNISTYFSEIAHSKLGFPLGNIQLWSGAWGTELIPLAFLPKGGAELRRTLETRYSYSGGSCPKEWQIVTPFLNIDYLKFIIESSLCFRGDRLRPELLATTDKHLAQFPNLVSGGFRFRYRIADWALKKGLGDYRKSWYGQTVRPKATWPSWQQAKRKRRPYSPMVAYWTIASLCDHLLANGYKIKIRNKSTISL